MRRLVTLLSLGCAAALAAPPDPEGTVVLDLEIGETAPVKSTPGASVLCDDPAIAAGEFTLDGNGFVIRGLRPGSTLCGVWLAGQTPGGLYRVHVRSPRPDAGDSGADAGHADAGAPDGGAR